MYPLITCISVLSLASLGVNADYEIDQCYWGPRQQLPSGEWRTGEAYVPCGEADDEVQSCCRVGHNCLEANACYAPDGQSLVHTTSCQSLFVLIGSSWHGLHCWLYRL